MEKVIWLLWGDPSETLDVVDRLRPLVDEPAVRALVVNQHDAAANAAPSPVPAPPAEPTHLAEVGAWFDNYQHRTVVEDAIARLGRASHAYLVVESLVDDYGTTPHAAPRDWPDGERSPGVLTVALIHRPEPLTEAAWLHNWHEVQSPVSGELQPRCRYVRNQVVRALSLDAPDMGGIVDEAWPSAAHVADPMLFFNAGGDRTVLKSNLERMLATSNGCLDMVRLRSTTMSEHLLKSFAVRGHSRSSPP